MSQKPRLSSGVVRVTVEAPLLPNRLCEVLRVGYLRMEQKRNNWPACHGCGPKIDAYYSEHSLAVHDENVDGARKTGVDWEDDAICIICQDPLAGPAGGVDVEDNSVEALVENVTVKRCNHVFHTACLKAWIQRGREDCPTCQTPLDYGVVMRLQYGHPGDHMVKRPNGAVDYYQGPTGKGRMVRTYWPDGTVQYYTGPTGKERMMRTKWPDGTVQFYDGPRGEEHMVNAKWPNGDVQYYEGPRGEERKVRMRWPDGTEHYYEGPNSREHKVRTKWPDGKVDYYDGQRGEERVVRSKLAGDMLPRVEDMDAHADL